MKHWKKEKKNWRRIFVGVTTDEGSRSQKNTCTYYTAVHLQSEPWPLNDVTLFSIQFARMCMKFFTLSDPRELQ